MSIEVAARSVLAAGSLVAKDPTISPRISRVVESRGDAWGEVRQLLGDCRRGQDRELQSTPAHVGVEQNPVETGIGDRGDEVAGKDRRGLCRVVQFAGARPQHRLGECTRLGADGERLLGKQEC